MSAESSADEGRQGVLEAAWRFKWLTGGTTLLVALLVVATSVLLAGAPSATVKLALANATESNILMPGTIGDSAVTRYVNQRADFLTSDELLARVQEAGVDDTVENLRDRIDVSTGTGSNVLEVSVSGDSAAEVTLLAQTLVDVYAEMTEAEVLDRSRTALDTINADIRRTVQRAGGGDAAAEQSLIELRAAVTTIKVDAATFGDGVDWATIPSEDEVAFPVPSPRDVVVGLVLGLMLGMFLAWILADSRRVVRSGGHASRLLGAPLLAAVRGSRRLRQASSEVTPSLALSSRTQPGSVVVLDAASRNLSGRVARVVAAGLALQGSRVLLVDQSGRKSGGVRQFVDGKSLETLVSTTQIGGVTVHTLGASNHLADFASGPEGVARVLHALESSYEWVIIEGGRWDDAPSVAFVVANAGAVVAATPSGGRESDVLAVRESLMAVEVPIDGVVYVEV